MVYSGGDIRSVWRPHILSLGPQLKTDEGDPFVQRHFRELQGLISSGWVTGPQTCSQLIQDHPHTPGFLRLWTERPQFGMPGSKRICPLNTHKGRAEHGGQTFLRDSTGTATALPEQVSLVLSRHQRHLGCEGQIFVINLLDVEGHGLPLGADHYSAEEIEGDTGEREIPGLADPGQLHDHAKKAGQV
jgi:hypothetical protein